MIAAGSRAGGGAADATTLTETFQMPVKAEAQIAPTSFTGL
jgi:hypothetical protein